MTKKLTLYHEASKGGFKQWSIWIEKDKETVTVEWGLVGKSLQTSSDTAVPKGKPGTKSYKDEPTCAQENYDRQVRKKREEGYRESMDAQSAADYLEALDKNFVPAKPVSSMDDEDAAALDRQGKLYIQRKRDGRRHLALKTRKGDWRIYSRRMEDLTGHLKVIGDALAKLNVPNGTILDGEVIIDERGRDNFKSVGRFTNYASDPLDAQKTAKQYNVCFMVFDVLYYDGKPVWSYVYGDRYELMKKIIPAGGLVYRAENLTSGYESLKHQARAEGWEGLILWQKDMPTFVRIGGKPKRCNCAKWKPVQERDFIATGWYYGSGELSHVVGGFNLADIDPQTGEQRDCGNVGTGLDGLMRKEALNWDYPCVLSIKFDKQESTAKLRFPVVLKKHEDKTPDECIGLELDGDDE